MIALNSFIQGRCSLHLNNPAKLKFIYSDLEGVLYGEQNCRKWMRENGVHVESCPPNHHEMNSAAEHDGYLIEQMVNAMLNFARAPEALWPFGVVQAVRLLNMREHPSLFDIHGSLLSPFRSAFPREIVSVDNFHTMFCPLVYLSADRTKLDDRGDVGIYLGPAWESQFCAISVPHASIVFNGSYGCN